MPIIVRHEPDPEFLAQIGYYTGMGQHLQWQQELEQRERMQQRAMEMNLLSQRLGQQAQLERQMLGIGADFEQQQRLFAQQEELQRQRALDQEQLLQLRQQDDEDLLRTQYELRRQAAREAGLEGEELDATRSMWGVADLALKTVTSLVNDHGYTLSPEQQSEFSALFRELSEIEANQTLTKPAKAQAYLQKILEFSPTFFGKAPTKEEQMQAAVGSVEVDGRQVGLINRQSGWEQMNEDEMGPLPGPPRWLRLDDIMSDREYAIRWFGYAANVTKPGPDDDPMTPEQQAARGAEYLYAFFDQMEKLHAEKQQKQTKAPAATKTASGQPKPLNKPGSAPPKPSSRTSGMIEIPDEWLEPEPEPSRGRPRPEDTDEFFDMMMR